MRNPRICFLTTLGIKKHYRNDYPFHHLRTDFIGNNGVGKSIITDLLQLMFFYDSSIIRFGTEGVKKDKRLVENLPYKSNIAYCLMTVETKPTRFIILGIMIRKQGRRVTPFVITKRAELYLSEEMLTLSAEELLSANDLLVDRHIPDLAKLSRKLQDTRGLYLTSFHTWDAILSYYKFLYEKHILSINLANEKNYKAYAKVIQSFSKVKTFNMDGTNVSHSLKEFLFDNVEADLTKNYNERRESLHKILKDYQKLSDYIQSLIRKQEALNHLEEYEKVWKRCLLDYKIVELNYTRTQLVGYTKRLEQKQKELQTRHMQQQNSLERIKKLSRIRKRIDAASAGVDRSYAQYSNYQKQTETLSGIRNELEVYQSICLPAMDAEWKEVVTSVSVEQIEKQQIVGVIRYAIPFLEKYGTWRQLEAIWKSQRRNLKALEEKIATEKQEKNRLLQILKDNSGNSLIHWYIEHRESLSEDHLHALLHYAVLPTTTAHQPKNRDRVVDPRKLFDGFSIEKIENPAGYWLRLGAMKEFITPEEDAQLFQNPDFEDSVKELIQRLEEELSYLERQEQELDNISRAQSYDKELLPLELDLNLIEYSNLEKIKRGVALAMDLNDRIDKLKLREKETEKLLAQLRKDYFPTIRSREPETIKVELDKLRQQWSSRSERHHSRGIQEERKLNEIRISLKGLALEIPDLQKQSLECEQVQQRLEDEFARNYPEKKIAYVTTHKDEVTLLEEKEEKAFEKYKDEYKDVVREFEETREKAHPDVNREIDEGNYSLQVLEGVLLTSRVRRKDNIASALKEANQQRLSIADNIRTSMLEVFKGTLTAYKQYKEQIKNINAFFIGRKISEKYYFKLEVDYNSPLPISFLERMIDEVSASARQGELVFEKKIDDFIEEFFQKLTHRQEKLSIEKLLSPFTYFELNPVLSDTAGNEIPGSSGESYSAIALLGIARLSVVAKEQRPGLRFIILEELGSLDEVNYTTFPDVAKEFDYQIITMAPHVLEMGLKDDWYAHHLYPTLTDKDILSSPCLSYFKSKELDYSLFKHLQTP